MSERSKPTESVADILKSEAVILAFAAAAFLLLGLLV